MYLEKPEKKVYQPALQNLGRCIGFYYRCPDFRAIEAILVSGIYYLVLHAKNNGSTFCEVDINREEDKERIKNAFSYIVAHSFKDAEKKKTT